MLVIVDFKAPLRQLRKHQPNLCWGWLWVCFAVLGGCAPKEQFEELTGTTMGTYYRVQYASDECMPDVRMIEVQLATINSLMSTYDPDSQLSRFNRHADTSSVPIDPQLAHVISAALRLWQDSEGAFDVTSGALVNLWGFGTQEGFHPPDRSAQEAALALVGSDQLHLQNNHLRKTSSGVYVDLSAIAKGYAVDQVAVSLQALGCQSLLVDIGGEMRLHGNSPRGGAWRIGIESPEVGALGRLHTVLALQDIALATSGDYRNFRMVDGARVDHLMDPRLGGPATSAIASATVLHADAMWADGLATAAMVLGEEAALRFAEAQGFALYLIVHDTTHGGFRTRYNARMAPYLTQPET